MKSIMYNNDEAKGKRQNRSRSLGGYVGIPPKYKSQLGKMVWWWMREKGCKRNEMPQETSARNVLWSLYEGTVAEKRERGGSNGSGRNNILCSRPVPLGPGQLTLVLFWKFRNKTLL